MDNVRLVAAIVLSILVFVVWDYFFVEKKKVQQPSGEPQVEQTARPAPEVPPKETVAAPAATPLKAVSPQPSGLVRTITVNTPLYAVKISEKGAEFKSFILKDYRKNIDVDSPSYQMVPPEMGAGTVRLGFAGKSFFGLEDAVFLTEQASDTIDIKDQPRTVSRRIGFEGPSALINNKVERVKIKKIKDKNVFPGKLKWVAIQNRYFISAVIPENANDASMRLFVNENDILENQYVHPESVLAPGSQQVLNQNRENIEQTRK